MINIAICDDDNIFANELKMYLEDIESSNDNMDMSIYLFYSSQDFLSAIENGKKFDVVFLDIIMPDYDGTLIGRKVRENFDTILVYISVSDQHFVDIFNVKPFGFLLKPLNYDDFKKIFFIIYEELYNSNSVYEFKFMKSKIRVRYNDILYLRSKGRKISIKTRGGEYDFYGKIRDVYDTLKNFKFMWIHKSYIINYNHIKEITYDHVIMSDGKRFDISERRKKQIRELYMKIGELSEVIIG